MYTSTITIRFFVLSLSTLIFAGCSAPKGTSLQEKRDYSLSMLDESLEMLYAEKPEQREVIANAAGYGAFSNFGMHIFVLATGNGFGVVVDNANDDRTYMRMTEVGAGIGLGVKGFRAVFVFYDRETLQKFIESGWEFGAEADAAAKAGDSGGAVAAAGTASKGMDIYQFTENGLALQATVSGTKYWKDKELN